MTRDLIPEDLPQGDRATYIAAVVAGTPRPNAETLARLRALLPPAQPAGAA